MTAQTNGHFEVLELPNLQDSITIFNNVEEKSISSQTELVILSQSPARAMGLSDKKPDYSHLSFICTSWK